MRVWSLSAGTHGISSWSDRLTRVPGSLPVYPVDPVYLVYLVEEPNQPDKPDKPKKPNRRNRHFLTNDMSLISRITLGQGLSLDELRHALRRVLKERYVEIWSDVFDPGVFWVADDARQALEEVGIAFTTLAYVQSNRIPVYYPLHLHPDTESLPSEDSVRARVLAGHGIGAVLFFIGDGKQMPPEEPVGLKDPLFYLSKPGAGYYYLWKLFRSKEEAEQYGAERLKDEAEAQRWAVSIPVMAYDELLQPGKEEDQP